MKTFKELISEVSQPNSEDELNFKEKHIIEPMDHPVAPEYVFSGDVDKDDADGMKRYRKNKRLADYQNPEDMEVYEGVSLTRDIPGQEGADVDNDKDSDMTDAQLRYRRHAQIKLHKIDEGATFVIPEAILATERDAFHSKAADAHQAGYTEFDFRGKTYPVTMSPAAAKTFAGKGKGLVEKVKEPYAVGMAQAMKSTGDKPPLSKKTITLAHKIAKGIEKNEALDPVGKENKDIDNNGKLTKHDKYLHNRRKAIAQSIRTKIKEGFGAVTAAGGDFDEEESHKTYKKGNMATKKEAVTLANGKGLKIFAGKTKESQIDEEADPETGHGVFLKGGSAGEKRSGKPIQVHSNIADAEAQAKRLNKLLSPGEKQHYRLKYHVKPVTEGFVVEEIELDEAPGQRSSAAYRMTVPLKDGQVHPDHAEKINDLKAKVRADNAKEGTKNKVVLQGRLGKDNPNAPKYKSKYTGKSYPGSHQRIKLSDASHADVYVREEVEGLDELKKSTLSSYIKKASGSMAGNAALAAAQASSSMKKSTPEVKRNIGNRMKGITRASDKLANEEVEQIDELSKDTLTSYAIKAHRKGDMAARMSKSGADKDMANYANKRFQGVQTAIKKLGEESQIDEAFNAGIVKLNDGSSVLVKENDAKLLNSLISNLKVENRSKMMQVAMKDKKGFNDILSFAKEAI